METYRFELLKKRVKENLPNLFNRKTIRWDGDGTVVAHLALVELIESGRIHKRSGALLTSILFDQFMQEAIPIVDRWDIRDAQSLAALIPNTVPSWIEQGRFTAEIDAAGEWVLRKAA